MTDLGQSNIGLTGPEGSPNTRLCGLESWTLVAQPRASCGTSFRGLPVVERLAKSNQGRPWVIFDALIPEVPLCICATSAS